MGPQHVTYTGRALAAILEAAWNEHDFRGWLADVLAPPQNSAAATPSPPGDPAPEADLTQRLLKGTVGWNHGCLSSYAKDNTATGSDR